MRGTAPIVTCDGDDGFCDAWDVDHYEAGVSSVDGIRLTESQRVPGWATGSADYCPDHKSTDQGSPRRVPCNHGEDPWCPTCLAQVDAIERSLRGTQSTDQEPSP